MKKINMNDQIPPFIKAALLILGVLLCGQWSTLQAQTPTITVRFNNPVYNCMPETYCVDVEFISDTPDQILFGMNVRFFYDDEMLELVGFSDFQGGYGPVSPDPPTVTQSPPGVGYSLFGFGDPGTGIADFINGAIQLVDEMQPSIVLSTTEWTKLFQICFTIDDAGDDIDSFCPPLVWDLEVDPEDGGFLIGDDGVVITVVDPDPNIESAPADENVVQFNWIYTGDGTPPYGEPVEEICISLDCSPMLMCAADITIECDESTLPDVTGMATATDICEGDIVITYEDVTLSGNCTHEYTITRTWIATNDCDLADTCVQIISIVDTTPPGIECPADVTIECTDSTSPDSLGEASATDNCDASPEISFSDTTTGGACPQEYTITRTWLATDDCDNSATCVQTITVRDTQAPSITCPADVTIECTASTLPANTGTAVSTDNCDLTPTVSFSDVTTGGACPQEYTITRTWVATDDCGNSSSCIQTITVDDSLAPAITCPANITIECTASTLPANTGSATATDNCDPTPLITFSDITAGGLCPQEYTITRTWFATDDCGNSSSCFQVITVDDSQAPAITCPANVTIECTASTLPANTGSATATDNCDATPLISFSDVTVGGLCPQEYTITRTWFATDDCGNSSSCTQIISVDDSTAPAITCPANVTIECTASTLPGNTGTATATDACDPTPVITFTDASAPGACAQESTITRTWIATDACGNSSTCVQTIFIDDSTSPSIACPANITIECTASTLPANTGTATASDNCDPAPGVTFNDMTVGGACAQEYTINRTWTATDACGNTSTCLQIIVVDDSQPPSITCPANITVSCASEVPAPNPGSVTSTDNCGGTPVITHVGDVISNQTCANRYTITRTYQSTDPCGNSSTCTQIITVNDIAPPSITCPANVTVSCANLVPAVNTGSVITSDNCGGVITVLHLGDVISNQTCANRFTVTRTYQATDVCGNSSTCAQIITVNDVTPPAITCPPNITVDFGDDTSPQTTGVATGTDNCGGIPAISSSDVTVAGICDESFTINRTWLATDACGNTSTCLQVIEVMGNCLIDLALTKTLANGQGHISPGDNIKFNITVTNEGEVAVGSVTIIDYIPVGFVLNDPAWTPGNSGSTGQSATITISIGNGGLGPNGLLPGQSATVMITLQALPNLEPGVYFNTAEILFVLDIDGNDVSDLDVDSTPDDDDTNDPPGEDDIDQQAICVIITPIIVGDGYVCPGATETYTVTGFNPNFTYIWSINGGGTIIENNGSSIVVQWGLTPGGPFQINVTVVLGPGCSVSNFFFVYIQGIETLACNDLIQISLNENCEAVILSGMILEGEAEGNNNYFVVITDQHGNVIPNATLTHEHIGQTFMVSVQNECNNQSCWGTIVVEDKIPPVIMCTNAVVPCGTPLAPVFTAPVTGSISQLVQSGLPIGPAGGTITNQAIDINLPANALITDVNVTVDLDHTWSADLLVELISPNGSSIILANAVCGSADNWDNVTFDDQAMTPVALACNIAPPPALLQGFVIPEEALATFNGEFADGTWTLRITDLVSGDGGVLNHVTLHIAYVLSLPYAPEASDACGTVTLTYTETESGTTCETHTIIRVWTATDGSGNTATCVQTITILPLDLQDVVFPGNYSGECGTSVDPEVTGWPSLNGQDITNENELCNIFLGYWDKELVECGGGRKIIRSWTVLDWCTSQFLEGIQIIKLTDTEGPVLICPAPLQVGTDFWYCHANVSVPKPEAYDNCSQIVSYTLASTGGIIVQYGSNYVINELPLGTHTVTWTVADQCGNSSTCSFQITVVDDVVPVVLCDLHTIVSLTNDGPRGVTLVPAEVFDDGSYDNCGPVTFLVSRMTPPSSCINFDWTTNGACIDDIPNGQVNSRDQGTVPRPCVPFACCDVGAGPVMVILEVTDAAGNMNFCMVEAIVQDKISPFIIGPPDIIVSCDFWFHVETGVFTDANANGNLDEDPLTSIFGNVFDAFRYNNDESVRQSIIIHDPTNFGYQPQPYNWGRDGWAIDNCEVNLQVTVNLIDDCSGGDLPFNAPAGAVKLITRTFRAADGGVGSPPGTYTQRIWVVDYDPFTITDTQCGLVNSDDVRWPCDLDLDDCPGGELTPDQLELILPAIIRINARPVVNDDACSLIGVTYEDQRFDFVDGACFKILRKWSIIDWCQYNAQTGAGFWNYTQVIKVHDTRGPQFTECPSGPVRLCVSDPGVTLPDNNQAFLGEANPLASSCSVHLNISQPVRETCSGTVKYDVKFYPYNGSEFIQVQPTRTATVDANNIAQLTLNTRESNIQSVRLNGLPYNSPWCGDYHRILWSVEDGCGNWSHCEYLLRLEDCKQPSPVCINGLSTVVMPIGGEVTIWAKDFNASSFDDCNPASELLYSFSGDAYQPSYTYNCENVPAFGVEISTLIWVADGGVDHNCNGQIEWSERNKDFCTTTIVIIDNHNVCDHSGSILAGDILTATDQTVEKVHVTVTTPGHFFPTYVTATNGHYVFTGLPWGQDYTIRPERLDHPMNGVSTLDLVRIQKHLLGIEAFDSPYQYIAADANNNGQVSAIDLVEIRKLILGLYSSFPDNTSWRFVERGYEMETEHPWPFSEVITLPVMTADSLMHNDFVAVKIGDVNNTVKANATQIVPRNGSRILKILTPHQEVTAGAYIDMLMTVPEALHGFQWTLETEGLEFAGISSEDITIGDQHVGVPARGKVTMSWHELKQGSEAANEAFSFTIRWRATASGQLASMLHLSGAITAAEAYTVSDEILDVKLAFAGAGMEEEFALYQNVPNPWNGQTTIGFHLPEASEATLILFDAAGRELRRVTGEYAAGYNSVSLVEKDIPSTGVIYYRLDSGAYSATKKMVMMK